jgi:ligand-binding sensor domain-containing protein/signal transduction histidine kinase
VNHAKPISIYKCLYTVTVTREKCLMAKCLLKNCNSCAGEPPEVLKQAFRGFCVLIALWLLAGLSGSDLQAASTAGFRPNSPFIIDNWTTDDGLPQNSVTSIVQARDGYLWLGTLNGLVRFDGQRFAVFDESNTPGLNSGRIVKVFEDSTSGLWVGTETAGIQRIKDGQVTWPASVRSGQSGQVFSTGIGQGGFESRLMSACEDASGGVWLYTADGQLWRYAGGRFDVLLFGQGRTSTCRSIICERSGQVWIGVDWRLCTVKQPLPSGTLELPVAHEEPVRKLDYLVASSRTNGGYWRLADQHVQFWTTNGMERDLGPYPWGRAPVSAACEDRNGHLVVGTLGVGVYWFDDEGKAAWINTSLGLSHDVVLSVSVDRENTLWVGTDGGGLNRVKRKIFEVVDVALNTTGGAVQSACEDDEGGVWIGSNGGGAAYWKQNTLERFGANQGLASAYVWSVYVNREKQVWVGTWGGGLYRLLDGRFQRIDGPPALQKVVSAIHQDRQGRMWFGTQVGLVCWDGTTWKVLTTREGLSANEVRAIGDDADGNLWIGTAGGGLNCLRGDRFTVFHKKDGLPSEDITTLLVDAQGIVWVGGPSGGLGRLEKGQWTRCTTREGLASNSISYIVEDRHGFLWLGSNAGIMRVARRELDALARSGSGVVFCRTYGKPDGLPTRECTTGSQPGGWLGRDDRLWLPTAKGLVSVNPGQINSNPYAPPVVIESVLIDGQLQNTNTLQTGLTEAVVVPPGRERIEIHFTSLNLTAPERSRFKYRLENYETEWTEAGNSHVARYSKLPPRQFRFQVTACNEDGVWNDTGSSLMLQVTPPFWRTWWFLGGAAIALLGSIIGIVHYVSTQKLQRQLERLKQHEALEKERSRIAQDIHDQLGANLTQVSLLGDLVECDKDHPEEVEAHARQISQTARETTRVLDEIVWAVNPSNDTLEGLVNYICKHAQDYLSVAGIHCRLDVPDQLPAINIPPEYRHNYFLTFKESITNVVRHAKATKVSLRLRLESGMFIMEIEDDGCGLGGMDEKAALTRNGLSGMRKRMDAIGGKFSIQPGTSGGTLVRASAPTPVEAEA